MFKSIQKKKEYRTALILLVIAVALELFVFNFRYWESMGNTEITSYELRMGEGLQLLEDGSYMAVEGERYLEFASVNRPLTTLFIDVEVQNREDGANLPITLQLLARDTSHEYYYWMPERQLWHSQEKSQYLTFHLYGDCKSLKVIPSLEQGMQVKISYTLNPQIPMLFSVGRVMVLWLFFVFLYLLRPSSVIYRLQFLNMKQGRSIAFVSFFLVHLFAAYLLVGVNPFFQSENATNHQQYQNLAESFLAGRVSLLHEPPQSLKDMTNPYDHSLRNAVMEQSGEGYFWDQAYFDGKYYVYFGAVPAALLYLPYYLVMGEHLHNWQAIFLGAGMLLAGIMGIISQIIKRWFPKTSLGIWYLLSELVVLGSGYVYMCKRPDLYTVPIIVGLGLGLLGIWALLCAEENGKLCPWKLAMGSLLLSLVAGCRPQLFLMVLIPVCIYAKYLFSTSFWKSGEGRCCGLAVCIPMIVVAAVLMAYNGVRFGSVFDFGANYNLTFNDMRNRGFHLDRFPLGFWAYLFAPLPAKLVFPFAEANYFQTQYLGVTISEATYGGIFAVNLFAWLGPMLFVFRKYVKKGTAMRLAYLCMGIGLVILCVDTQMSGILMRYFSDFQIFFLLASLLAFCLFYESAQSPVLKKYLQLFLVICLLAVVVYQGRIFFLDTGEALIDLRKDLFAEIKYQVMFWL